MDRIIIINHYGCTPDQPGATKHYDMAKYFSKKGDYLVEFWMCGYRHYEGKMDPILKGFRLETSYMDENLKIVKIKSTPYRNSSLMRQLNHTVFELISACKILLSKDIKLIVMNIPPNPIFNTWAANIRHIKLIADVEDLWPLFPQQLGMNNKLAIRYMDIAANYLYRTSAGIEAVSDGMLRFVKSKLTRTDQMIWLAPLGVDLKSYDQLKKDVSIEEKPWKQDLKIMYLGAHGRANNLESVVRTAKALEGKLSADGRKISFILIGDGDRKEALRELVAEIQPDNVYLEDAVPGDLVPAYLEKAEICLTNLKKVDSFKLVRPNKLFQYMAASKPILCGIWGEAAEIVRESGAGIYVDFDEPEYAAKQILEFISDEERLRKCGRKGRLYIEQHGDRDKIFEEFYQRIKQILGT